MTNVLWPVIRSYTGPKDKYSGQVISTAACLISAGLPPVLLRSFMITNESVRPHVCIHASDISSPSFSNRWSFPRVLNIKIHSSSSPWVNDVLWRFMWFLLLHFLCIFAQSTDRQKHAWEHNMRYAPSDIPDFMLDTKYNLHHFIFCWIQGEVVLSNQYWSSFTWPSSVFFICG